MAHGLNSVLKRGATTVGCKSEGKTGIGSRRIFAPHFKLQVLDSYRNDADCKGNQRATARKYGIHRRQIQKWLQVENNLRNSVAKGKPDENPEAIKSRHLPTRHRDDFCADAYSQNAQSEARVPALSPVVDNHLPPAPLDFTTHSRGHGSPIVASPGVSPAPPDPAAPMDLSFKRPGSVASSASSAPVTYPPLSPTMLPSPPSLAQPHPDVWDLSVKRKSYMVDSIDSTQKPVKLFKPYLDDVQDEEPINPIITTSEIPPCCSSGFSNCDAYYYNNNNNNICEIKSEYSYTTYTLHELQPKSSLNYYYTFPGTYQGCEYDVKPFYEDANYMQGGVPLKQRHSYSLDFKLSAIECYYQDSVCKGNQRAVASKYNIHRRQVQKWLKQADELKQKNEVNKQTHAVR